MQKKIRSLIVSLIVFALVLSLFSYTAWSVYIQSQAEDKNNAKGSLAVAKSVIESVITARIISAKGLIAYIQINPHLSKEAFDNFAAGQFDNEDLIIRNTALLKDTTIIYNYPLEGNEKTIGVDLSTVDIQKITVNEVKKTGKMHLIAPVNLIQGGTGIIVRIPINIKDPATDKMMYWGQMSMVFDYDKLLVKSGLMELSKDHYIQLIDKGTLSIAPKLIWGNIDTLPSGAILENIDLFQASWDLSLIRKQGWQGSSIAFWILLTAGLLTATGSAYGLYALISSRSELEKKVNERTAALKLTNNILEQSLAELEENQAELTEVNHQLEYSLSALKTTQNQLIISEKLAALGELVAGVAHEINTPLGISVTLGSFVSALHQEFKKNIQNHTYNFEIAEEFIHTSEDAIDLMNINLERASGLVNSFKQVAVDQASEDKRKFSIKDALQDVLKSLHPKLKKSNVEVILQCADNLIVDSYPGALSQIITNLVINSIIHGFSTRQNGKITITVTLQNRIYSISYRDDGIGIPNSIIDKVFNPFFSTRKQSGSTGLGLHIVHNLVTQSLKGNIQLTSEKNQGVHFIITFDE
jgi:signal transduction histidine kinase